MKRRSIGSGALYCLSVAVPMFVAQIAQASMTTPGQFSVSESGAATYTVPIRIPPGTAGMEPKLALSYDSQGGNGLLGVGWSLTGLSAITRCPQTLAQDGNKGSVRYDANDRYCLDGQRLIAINNGVDGANGTEYRTERDSFSKIVSYVDEGIGGPTRFSVWTKSGQEMQYGSTPASRIQAGTTNITWALSSIKDTKGNYFNIGYAKDAGGYWPDRIDYTGNATIAPYNSVQIAYEAVDRPDVVPQYHAGYQTRVTKRMSGIRTYAGTTLVKEYRLTYDQEPSTGRSRLRSISECSGANVCLPPVSVEYGSSGAVQLGETVSVRISDWGYEQGRAWADFDGDGRADFCRVIGSTFNGGSGDSKVACSTGISASALNGAGDIKSAVLDWGNPSGRAWGDFNGDGKADFCRVIGDSYPGNSQLACTLSIGNGFGPTVYSNQSIDWGHLTDRAWIDVNSDGRIDYCRRVGNGGSDQRVACTLASDTGFGNTVTSEPLISGWGENEGRSWADVNGDGRSDFCRVIGSDGARKVACTLLTDAGFGETIYSGIIDWGYPEGRAWVDANGDGKSDFCRIVGNPGAYSLRCILSNGKALIDEIYSGSMDPGYPDGREWADVNGDGMADYCRRVGGGVDPQSIECTLSAGTKFEVTVKLPRDASYEWGQVAGAAWVDANGDGQSDFCRVTGTANMTASFVSCTLVAQDIKPATRIHNGIGGSASIEYKPLAAVGAPYIRDANAIYPVVDVQIPLYAVSSVATSNGRDGVITTTYSYGGLKANVNGRGLIGFRWMQTETPASEGQQKIRTLTEYRQDWPYTGMETSLDQWMYYGTAESQEILLLLKTVRNEFGCRELSNPASCSGGPLRVSFPYVGQSTESSYDLNGAALPTVTTTNEYDEYGNATRIVVSTDGAFTKATVNEYFPVPTGSWYLGRLKSATVTSTIP